VASQAASTVGVKRKGSIALPCSIKIPGDTIKLGGGLPVLIPCKLEGTWVVAKRRETYISHLEPP